MDNQSEWDAYDDGIRSRDVLKIKFVYIGWGRWATHKKVNLDIVENYLKLAGNIGYIYSGGVSGCGIIFPGLFKSESKHHIQNIEELLGE